MDIRRHPGSAVFTVRKPLTAEELVHPYLTPVAAVAAHWHGRESFHAGAVAIGGSAWALVGDRHTGKSSLLAALALRGVDIVCDDVLVVAGKEAFVGPRTVDLRQDAPAVLGTGVDIGIAGARERWPPAARAARPPAHPRGLALHSLKRRDEHHAATGLGDAATPSGASRDHCSNARSDGLPSPVDAACPGAAEAANMGGVTGRARRPSPRCCPCSGSATSASLDVDVHYAALRSQPMSMALYAEAALFFPLTVWRTRCQPEDATTIPVSAEGTPTWPLAS